MPFKTLQLELKSSKSARTIEGYFSVFGNKDFDNEYVLPGSMKASIAERFPRIPLLWQHDPRLVIGKPLVMHEDSKGVYFKDRIAKTPLGDEALILTSSDDGGPYIDGVSFGYDIIDSGPHKDGVGLKTLDVYEHTLTTFPANDLARVQAVKERWAKLNGLYLKAETISALAMSTSMDKGPTSVASALSLLLDTSDGNRGDVIEAWAEALGVEVDVVFSLLAGSPPCPPVATLETMAEILAIDVQVLLAAGNRGGCEYELQDDVIEVSETSDEGKDQEVDLEVKDEEKNEVQPESNNDDFIDLRDKVAALSQALDDMDDIDAMSDSIERFSAQLDELTPD
jgi:HK97 family phage prohead protease